MTFVVPALRPHRIKCALAAWAALMVAGCGGGDAPLANEAPVGRFTMAGAAQAGVPVALDASASSDADGDALNHHWDFGDGQRGGGARIAHVFVEAGHFAVRLTVDDGRGGRHQVDQTVTVSAPPAPAAMVNTRVTVRALDGTRLSGVSVQLLGAGAASAATNSQGRATLATGTAVAQMLKFSKAGYADQFRNAALPAGAESGYLEVSMQGREAPLTLADAAAGGSLTGAQGAKVTFAPGSLVDAAGTSVSGPVAVSMTPVDVSVNARAFPGRFAGVRGDASQGLLLSYGTVEFALSAGGAPVQLAPGRKATIEIPVFTALHRDGTPMQVGDRSPLWSLDERTGAWTEEGEGTVVAASTPSGFALRAEVQHFSWWNHDAFEDPPARPKPRCLVDTDHDGKLEDLTGTGYCWHYGTGPDQPNTRTTAAVRETSAGRRTAAAEPRTQRIPAYEAWQATPASGGEVLPIPADMDITFRSYAKNGTLFGTRVVRMGAGVEEEVQILLEPVQAVDGTLAIVLPYDNAVLMSTPGEVDRFTFMAEANASYELVVGSAPGSTMHGSVRALAAGGTVLASGAFGSAEAAASTFVAPSAGTITVEVTAGGDAPGAYRIEVRKIVAQSCAAPTPLALPSTTNNVAVGGNEVRCFDLTLPAGQAIEIKTAQHLGARGTLTLRAASGEALAVDTYATTAFDSGLLRLAVAQAGAYRLEIFNSNPGAGTINGLSVGTLAADTLAVPQSRSFDGLVSGTPHHFVVTPPSPGAAFALALTASNGEHGYQVLPSGGGVVVSCSSCSAPATRALVHQASALVLPVVQVYRNNGNGNPTLTLASTVPTLVALDVDFDDSAPPPGATKVMAFAATAGTAFSWGTVSTISGGDEAARVDLYAPSGAGAGTLLRNRALTLPETGLYTVEVNTPASNASGPAIKLRLNTLAPPQALTLAALVERSASLALGQVHRYAFDLMQAQVLALRLGKASGALEATAVLSGGNVHDGFVTTTGAAPASLTSRAKYVQQSASALLTVASAGTMLDQAVGPYTLGVLAPTPAPTAIGALASGTLAPQALQTWGFTVAAAGEYRLCAAYEGPLGPNQASLLETDVWGPSAQFANAPSEMTPRGEGNVVYYVGVLRAGGNTVSMINRHTASVPAQARLVPNPAPTPLVLGAANVSASAAPCARSYHRFAATAGSGYTLRLNADFTGTVRVYKAPSATEFVQRGVLIDGFPKALSAGVEAVASFTIPATAGFGSGDYVVEVESTGGASGSYGVRASSP